MASEVNNVMAATAETETQIVGAFPQIIVTGTVEKPFYQIMYCENEDGDIHLGYGSYDLAYVFKWLEEFFGVTHASAVNPESLRPKGRWEYHDCVCTGDGLTSLYACSECHGAIDEEVFDNLYSTHYCPNCGAKMEEQT